MAGHWCAALVRGLSRRTALRRYLVLLVLLVPSLAMRTADSRAARVDPSPERAAALIIVPHSAVPREPIFVSGSGFGPSERLAFYWDGARRWPQRAVTTTAGTFAGAEIWVGAREASGNHLLVVLGQTTHQRAQTTILVPWPHVDIAPKVVAQKGRLIISGSGFGSSERLTFYWDGARRWPPHSVATTVGTFAGAQIWMARNETIGRHRILVVGQTTGRTAEAVGMVRVARQASAIAAHTLPAATATATSAHPIKTVFVLVMENYNWSQIAANPSAPYINNVLLPAASYTQRYYNPSHLHPSLPNYLWLEAGTNFGITNDAGPDVNHQSTNQHLVTLLQRAGISWKAYDEGISGTDCPLHDRYPYVTSVNPFVYFDDVTNGNDPSSATCIAHLRPFGELATDLHANSVARYNYITPNLCDDMHSSCAPMNDPVRQGDTWLSTVVPQILNSQAYTDGGAIFITWDEGEGSSNDGPIGMMVLSPGAKGHGYTNSITYTHSSTLRTIEEIFGVTPFLGDAAHATDLRDLFVNFP
jgi:phosphatidylinositol-3-phosphatase